MGWDTKHILVIDSESERRQMVGCILTDEGFAVTTVGEGFTAIRIAGARRFAMAIIAMSLPGMLDGPATIRQIRARQPWLKALYTGEAADCPWRAGSDCDDFIASPFRRRDLLGCVFELLQRDRARAELPLHRGEMVAGLSREMIVLHRFRNLPL